MVDFDELDSAMSHLVDAKGKFDSPVKTLALQQIINDLEDLMRSLDEKSG